MEKVQVAVTWPRNEVLQLTSERTPTRVLLTCDTELWPFRKGWPVNKLGPDKNLRAETSAYIYGETKGGDYGLDFQVRTLTAHELKGTFFVESLCMELLGTQVVAEWIRSITRGGQEIGLHAHTEWFVEYAGTEFSGQLRQYIHDFSEEEQGRIISLALERLLAAGASRPVAFRAGSYGGNRSTLRGLAANGISFDTSFNATVDESFPGLWRGPPRFGPFPSDGCLEIPVSAFSDFGNHLRHAQLCACSAAEMEAALWHARRRGWTVFVIVFHSGELVRKERTGSGVMVKPSRVNVSRFLRLCDFLGRHRDEFETVHFSSLPLNGLDESSAADPLSAPIWRTGWRMAEQFVSRFW